MESLNDLVGMTTSGMSVEELDDCGRLLRDHPLVCFVLSKGHPFLLRVGATLGTGATEERAAALDVLAWVARNPDNAEPVLYALEECGESLEKFTSQHTDLDGHRDKMPDEIYRNLLTLLMCSSGYTFRAAQLLELTDGKMHVAIAALAAVLRGPFGQAPLSELLVRDEMVFKSSVRLVACAAKVLCDLTTCDAYFQSTDARDYQTISIADLNKEFTHSISAVSRVVTQYPVFDLLTVHFEEWYQIVKKDFTNSMQGIFRLCGGEEADLKHPPLEEAAEFLLAHIDVGLMSALMTICHLLTYTTEYSARLRRYIANHTILIQNLVLPYAVFLCDILERTQTDSERRAVGGPIKQLLCIIKVLSFVTFRVKVFRPWFRGRNFTNRLLKSELLLSSNVGASILALLARLNVNIDAGDASHKGYADLLVLFRSAFDAMPETERQRVSNSLSSPTESMYPVNKCCGTYKDLSYLWEYSSKRTATEDDDDDNTPEPTANFKFEFNFKGSDPFSIGHHFAGRGRGGRGRGRGAKAWRGRGVHRTNPYQAQRHRQQQRRVLEKRWRELRRKKQATEVECNADEAARKLEEASLSSPKAFVFVSNTNEKTDTEPTESPATATEATPEEPTLRTITTSTLRSELRRQSRSDAPPPSTPPPDLTPVVLFKPTRLAPMSHPKGVELNSQFDVAKKPLPEAARIIWQPGTELAQGEQGGGEEGEGEGEEEAGDDGMAQFATKGSSAAEVVPEAFLCALTHQLLTHPVISPHGDVFERTAILNWFEEHGATCPVSNKRLEVTDLVPDYDLKKDIEEYRLKARVAAVL